MTELYLILGIVCSAAMTIALKAFPIRQGNRYGIILGNYLTCIVIAFFMIPDKSAVASINGTTLFLGAIGGVLFIAALVCMQSSIHHCGAILTSAFSRMGLVIPLVLSIFYLGERPGIWQIIGIIIVLGAIIFISVNKSADPGQDKGSGIHMLWLIAVLVTFGMGDSMAKVVEQFGERQDDGSYFLILFCVTAILALILMIREYKKTGEKPSWKSLLAGISVGVPNYFSSALLLRSLTGLPAIVVYPTFSTGTILLVTLVSALFFKERLDKRKAAGLVMILLAVVLLNIPAARI